MHKRLCGFFTNYNAFDASQAVIDRVSSVLTGLPVYRPEQQRTAQLL